MKNINKSDLKKYLSVLSVTNPEFVFSESKWNINVTVTGLSGADRYQIVKADEEIPRKFTTTDAALNFLFDIGVEGPYKFIVSNYIHNKTKGKKQPERAKKMKTTYAKATANNLLIDENGNCVSCGKPAVDHTHDHCRTEGIEKSVPER